MRLIDADALIKALEVIQYNDIDDLSRTEDLIDNAPTVSIDSCRDCPFVADEEKQITNGDAWKSYCEGQEVGFKKAEDVFKRMKLVQETVDCIRYTFKQDTESDKLVRNCMALVQNAIDGEYHDMEEVDVSEIERPEGKWIPVSERLPDLWAVVLVTDECGNAYEYERRPFDENGNEYNEWCFFGRKIIAWMPLPEPYKEGGEKE